MTEIRKTIEKINGIKLLKTIHKIDELLSRLSNKKEGRNKLPI